MELVRNFKDLNKDDISIAGGKGASLGEMSRAGIPVPEGFVILSSTFDYFLKETDLAQEIDSILHTVDHKAIHTAESASEKIRGLIENQEIPKDIAKEIINNFKQLGAEFVAVRSSATAEDGTEHAWAGQLESFLNTTKKNLLENVRRCWSSLFTPRAIFYRFEKGLHETDISVAVVVQKMIQSKVSGIAFSVHPITENRNQLIIEAGFGLGEAIVSGSITPDSYVIEKNPRRIIDTNINTQKRGLFKSKKGGNEWQNISEPKASSQVLPNSQILELADLVIKIEKHYGFPCDIEWAFEKEKFYITQGRPITTLSKQPIVRKFQKFFTREIALVVMEYWHSGEFEGLRKLIKGVTHFNPLFIRDKNGLISVYYDMNNPDTALQPLFDFLRDNPKEFNHLVGTFESRQNRLRSIVNNFKPKLFLELFNCMVEAWSYLPIWVQLGTVNEKILSKKMVNKSVELRDKFQELEYKVGKLLHNAICEKYPEIKDYADVISFKEIKENAIPNLDELKNRKKCLIYFEGKILSDLSIDAFLQKFQIELCEDLATIGELNLKPLYKINANKDVALAITEARNQKEIKGTTAFSGLVIGKVIIVMKKEDIFKVQKGDVLVCSMTSPDFIPAMKKASAFITDEGGVTSHAAITARELKKPCIIGTKIATQVLRDGDIVEVDADNGIIRKI